MKKRTNKQEREEEEKGKRVRVEEFMGG